MGLMDWFFIPAILFVSVLALVASLIVVDRVNDSGMFSSDSHAQGALDQGNTALWNMDNMLLFIVVGLCLFVIISSYFMPTHPVFFLVSVFLLLIAVAFSAIISNAYETFDDSTSTLNDTTTHLPKANLIMDKLPIWICIMAFVSLITMYIGYQNRGI